MVQLPNKCPFCGGGVIVTHFACPECDAVVEGRFSPHPLAVFDADQTRFVLAFLRNRGNIKDVERELGLSYPAVRAKISEVVKALGYTVDAEDAAAEETARVQRAEVLGALERGEIDAAQAAERLKQL